MKKFTGNPKIENFTYLLLKVAHEQCFAQNQPRLVKADYQWAHNTLTSQGITPENTN